MADFRKFFLVLLAGCFLFTTAASAVDYYCDATWGEPLVRAEGVAEMVGDVKLNCQGDIPNPAEGLTVNIRLTLSTNITSNLLDEGSGTPTVSEATLILDKGIPGFVGYSSITGSALNGYTDGRQNVYQAVRISDTELEWRGVVLAGPGSAARNQILLTNLRANASSVGDGGVITAFLNVNPAQSLTVNNSSHVVARVKNGLSFSVSDGESFKSCVEADGDDCVRAFNAKFAEGFASSFKPQLATDMRGIPGGPFYDESGFNPEGLTQGDLVSLDDIGMADQGTILRGKVKGVPSGVTLAVPLQITTGGMLLVLVDADGEEVDENDDFDCEGAVGEITLDSSGNGAFYYEVVEYTDQATAFATVATVTVPVIIAYDIPGTPGAATAAGSFYPISTTSSASASAPEPRFIDTSSDKAAFSISLCRTILLFPYVTNQAGFDTGIAISNTSDDVMGTDGQAGACKLTFFGNTNGSTGPAVQTTPSVPAGGHLVMLLSAGGSVMAKNGGATACGSGACVAPGFQGYVFATCDFQFAHGFAFVSDLGSQKLAMGYLALIVPDRSDRAPADSSWDADFNDGEGLAN